MVLCGTGVLQVEQQKEDERVHDKWRGIHDGWRVEISLKALEAKIKFSLR